MKIIIIGGGIAGLSSFLFLRKHLAPLYIDTECIIKVYEAYDINALSNDTSNANSISSGSDEVLFTAKVIGNAIGIGKNGLSVLSRIDSGGYVVKQIQARGNCVKKWRMGTARGWKIVDADMQSSGKHGNSEENAIADTVMIARQAAWQVLRDEVLRVDPNAIIKKKLDKIEDLPDKKVKLSFTDGSSETADLLVGADGLRSTVRKAIFEAHEDFYSQSWIDWILRRDRCKKDYSTPHYEGLTGLGGFIPSSVLRELDFEQDAMSITFGPNGFFGHGYIGPVNDIAPGTKVDPAPMAAWWSTFSSDTPRPYEDKMQSSVGDQTGIKTSFDHDAALLDLVARHKNWSDPTIQAIVLYLKESRDIEHIYPTYTTPELPGWMSKSSNIVLVGDAAHALQPSSGQGACQALEDAETLALFLAHYLDAAKLSKQSASTNGSNTGIEQALANYQAMRMPRVAKIYEQSQKMSRNKMDMGVVQEYTMYAIIWISTKLGMWRKYNDELFGYDLPGEVHRMCT